MSHSSYLAGFGSADITCFDPQLNLFGFCVDGQIASDVTLPLRARALAIEDAHTRRRFVLVVADLGCISESLRLAVVAAVCNEATGLSPHDLLLTATHTHSGPSGFSTYLLYALVAPGVSVTVHDALVRGIASAVRQALGCLRPARIHLHTGWVPVSEPVAFNRSIAAYNQNLDVTPVTAERADEALDRTMTVLRVDGAPGPPLGLVSFFAVHGTSVHSDGRSIHGDNKGYAALDCEAWAREAGHPGFVALFAQESAGDVSPNYRRHARRKLLIGRYDDDDASARWNGGIQSRHARALWALAPSEGELLSGPIDSALRYRDFFLADDDEVVRADAAPRRVLPRLGVAFTLGTAEGPGPLHGAERLLAVATSLRQRFSTGAGSSWESLHGSKLPFWDLGAGLANRAVGSLGPRNFLVEALRGRQGSYYRAALDYPFARKASWVPRYLPMQVARIGSFVLGAIPQEATTNAGRRIRRTLEEAWGPGTRAVLAPYSNAYCGYLTTPEEYDVQAFEGGMTLYGRTSLATVRREMAAVSRDIRAGTARMSLGAAPRGVPLDWCLPAPNLLMSGSIVNESLALPEAAE